VANDDGFRLCSVLIPVVDSFRLPITVAARSEACTVFDLSNTGIMGSNPAGGMDACVCVYSVFVLFCF
jgi:hypothetical protein